MLEVELDVFSGMPNPSRQLSEKEERELVDRVTATPEQMSLVADSAESFGLGYRGVIVRLVKPDTGAWWKANVSEDVPALREAAARPGGLPTECRLGTGSPGADSAAEWLITLFEKKQALDEGVLEVVQAGVNTLPSTDEAAEAPPEGDLDVEVTGEAAITPQGATWWACSSAYYSANAAYFNDPAHVNLNNCYCFASNHRPDIRYALPGKRGGHPATSITCAGCIAGLHADGWADGCQTNTLTIAMVMWPNTDYHFYRVVTGGPEWWWGHKPGGTPARYTDNSNQPLKQPRSPINCDRGPYTDFCGYFYQNNSTAFVA
jgi:hypothetical protein